MNTRDERLVTERLLRQVERLSLRARPIRGVVATGEHAGRGQAASLEVSDHRAYAPGDDFRRIDWNAFARLNSLNVKVSEPRPNLTLHLLIDRSKSMEFGKPSKSWVALQVGACLAYLALSQLDGVRVYGLSGDRLTRSARYWGRGEAAEALRCVATLDAGAETDLAAAVGVFLSSRPEHGLAVILTDLLSPTNVIGRLRQITSAGLDMAVIHILSQEELHPPVEGNLELVDSETGARRKIGATLQALLAYEQRIERWKTSLAEDFRALGVRYVAVSTERPIEAVMLADLRRGGLLE